MKEVSVGIDVACAKGKALPVCFIRTDDGIASPVDFPKELRQAFPRGCGNAEISQAHPFRSSATQTANALAEVARRMDWTIKRVAIDAPARPPLCGVRCAEAQLTSQGLPAFKTPDESGWVKIINCCRNHLARGKPLARLPDANRIWMLYGFEIFAAIRQAGLPAIEVYPYAIARSLLPQCPHKKTLEGYRAQLDAVAKWTGWRPDELEVALKTCCVGGAKDDRLDAFMAACVAATDPSALSSYGDPDDPDDSIWWPKIPSAEPDGDPPAV